MSYPFDLQAAITKISELEAALTGITTSYGYNANPVEITDFTKFPAVVHVPLGPRVGPGTEASSGAMALGGLFHLSYEVYSLVLVIESVVDQYPADEGTANLLWKPICETFFNIETTRALCAATGAATYDCTFPEQSYQPRPWPPLPNAPHWYWSFKYVHRFGVFGG